MPPIMAAGHAGGPHRGVGGRGGEPGGWGLVPVLAQQPLVLPSNHLHKDMNLRTYVELLFIYRKKGKWSCCPENDHVSSQYLLKM
jgi:hypothetical protein